MGSAEDIKPVATLADYVEPHEAAEMLGVKRSTIWNYIKRGLLKGRHFKGQGRRYFIRKIDVQSIVSAKEEIDTNGGSLKEIIAGIRIRLHSIESRMDFLMEALGLQVSVLRDKPVEDLLAIYNDAVLAGSTNQRFIPAVQVRKWADVLCQFT